MKRYFRLSQANDFRRAKTEGQSKKHKLVVLLFVRNNLTTSRTAFVASKKVGNAVVRNRVKRLMRAGTADIWSEIKSGWDLIFYARAAGAKASFQDWVSAIQSLLREADLIIENKIDVN